MKNMHGGGGDLKYLIQKKNARSYISILVSILVSPYGVVICIITCIRTE